MRTQRTALLCLIAALLAVTADGAFAQKMIGPRPLIRHRLQRADGTDRRRQALAAAFAGPAGARSCPESSWRLPQGYPSNGVYIDDGSVNDGPRRSQQSNRRGPSGAPPANERRLVPDEVVIEISNSVSAQQIDALQRRSPADADRKPDIPAVRHNALSLADSRPPLGRHGRARARGRSPRRIGAAELSVHAATRSDRQQTGNAAKSEGDPAQYELAKLHLPQAHALAKGDNVLVAVINSGVDIKHPELAGSIAGSFDTAKEPAAAHKHGTAIAGLIAAHAKLMGAAPAAKILAVHAFDPNDAGAEGTTFNILKGIDWAAAHGARVINMSFAGPADPAIHRSLEAARKKGIVLVAAAGNAGAKSPPLYPAADPNVIAVSATDADDKLFEQSNRGPYIAVAAPGAQILVAAPDSGYEVSSGTSYSAAEVSGIVALMLQRKPDLTPDKVRNILQATAKDLGPKGPDAMFGAGLADAYGAVTAETAPIARPTRGQSNA